MEQGITGLKLPGNLTVTIAWSEGRLTEAKIIAGSPVKTSVYCGDRVWPLEFKAGESIVLTQ